MIIGYAGFFLRQKDLECPVSMPIRSFAKLIGMKNKIRADDLDKNKKEQISNKTNKKNQKSYL